jgi:ATP-dependent helicase/nuclease subunit B
MVGWKRPLMDLACDTIWDSVETGDLVDCSALTVVFPGSRALRRFREKLALRAQEERRALFLPEMITVGTLPEFLMNEIVELAPPLVLERAWFAAIIKLSPSERSIIAPRLEEEPTFSATRFLTERLSALRESVCAGGKSFSDVLSLMTLSEEQNRWQVLTKLESLYLEFLGQHGVTDKHLARMQALKNRSINTNHRLILVGVTDMPAIARQFIDCCTEVVAIVGAPKECEELFTEHGEVVRGAHEKFAPLVSEVTLGLDHQELGRKLLTKIINAAGSEKVGYDGCSVGVPSAELAWSLKSGASQLNLPLHIAGEKVFSSAASFVLLNLLITYYTTKKTKDFFFLIRHPLLRAWTGMSEEGFNRMLLHSATYWNEHLQEYLFEDVPNRQDEGETIFALQLKLHQELGEKLPLTPIEALAWCVEGLKKLIGAIDPSDKETGEFIAKLIELHRNYSLYGGSLFPELDSLSFLKAAMTEIGTQTLGGESPHAIEVVGWLELLHDDAAFVAITGFEEGNIPDHINGDPFLPNGIRDALSLTDNEKRRSRDTFVLRNLIESRKQVNIGVAQQSSSGDLLFPSQLLFLNGTTKAKALRLKDFLSPIHQVRAAEALVGDGVLDTITPQPFHPRTLPVSSFKLFLNSPEDFYLRYGESLDVQDDSATDLAPNVSGTFIHKVLQRSVEESKGMVEEERLRELYRRIYQEECSHQFGSTTLPAVKLQLEILWSRLELVVEKESTWRKDGWICQYTEKKLPQDFEIDVDGVPVVLRGTIDRIDYNPATKTWCLLDYKTGKTLSDVTRQYHSKKKDVWFDLQLPLYYHAFKKELGDKSKETSLLVGLIRIPTQKNDRNIFTVAEWKEEDYQAALDATRQAIRKMREGDFRSAGASPTVFPWLAPLFKEVSL